RYVSFRSCQCALRSPLAVSARLSEQALTTLATRSHGIEAGPSVAPPGARDARVVVDLDYLPATPLGHLPKLADLIFHGLCVRGDPNVKRCTLCLGHRLVPRRLLRR